MNNSDKKNCEHIWEYSSSSGEWCPCTGWSGRDSNWECIKCHKISQNGYYNPPEGKVYEKDN